MPNPPRSSSSLPLGWEYTRKKIEGDVRVKSGPLSVKTIIPNPLPHLSSSLVRSWSHFKAEQDGDRTPAAKATGDHTTRDGVLTYRKSAEEQLLACPQGRRGRSRRCHAEHRGRRRLHPEPLWELRPSRRVHQRRHFHGIGPLRPLRRRRQAPHRGVLGKDNVELFQLRRECTPT